MTYKPFKKFSAVTPFFYLPLCPVTAHNAWKYIGTIAYDFFVLQLAQKFHITKRPVIYVDTEIDNRIPFNPSYVKMYMTLVSFFVRPISMMKKKLGFKKAYPYINEYLAFLAKIYHDASTIYRFCMSTTVRPHYHKKDFLTIHIFDPHLMCVPSIHVAIGAGVHKWFKEFFKEGLFPEEEAEFRLKEIWDNGFGIIESVLFVKQHSINCIPLALYMITTFNDPASLTIEEAYYIIDQLFVTTDEISPEDKILLRNHFRTMYDSAIEENKHNLQWQDSIKNWLIKHAKETHQNL